MRHRTRAWISILATALALGLAPAAHAVIVLATPPLGTPGGQLARCRIVNLGTRPITLTIEALDASGHTIFDDDVSVPPGAVSSSGLLATSTLNAYCKFAGVFSKALVRASIENYSGSEATSVLIVPAQ
jgi:hypothetical protein